MITSANQSESSQKGSPQLGLRKSGFKMLMKEMLEHHAYSEQRQILIEKLALNDLVARKYGAHRRAYSLKEYLQKHLNNTNGGSEKSSRDIEINSESDDIEENPEDDIESLVDSYIESDSDQVESGEGSAEYEDDMNHDYQGGYTAASHKQELESGFLSSYSKEKRESVVNFYKAAYGPIEFNYVWDFEAANVQSNTTQKTTIL